MLQKKSFVKGKVSWWGKLHCSLISRNCYTHSSLQQPPPRSGTIHQHWGKASVLEGFLHGSAGKESTCNARAQETSLIPGSGRFPGRGKGNSLQYSCLENPIDRGAWGLQSQGLQRVRHDWAQHRVQLSPLLLCFWLPKSSSINYGIYPAPDRKTVYC